AGRVLHSGDFVAESRNHTGDQTLLTPLRSEAETPREDIRSVPPLQEQPAAPRAPPAGARQRASAALAARLTVRVAEAEAQAPAAAREAAYRRWLLPRHSITQPAVDKAVNAAHKAEADAERARFAGARLRHDLAAARNGIGFAAQPDISYALHRLDEIATRETELSAQLHEQTSRLAEIERALPVEVARLQERSHARLVSPVDAIVWRPTTFGGGWVGPDRPVTTLIDCSERVIQAKLPGRQFEQVAPGAHAEIRILGNPERYEAVVLDR